MLKNKKTPAHSDIDRADTTENLSGDVASIFRTCVGILMYLANDVPHCQYVIRHLSTYSSKPTQKSLTVLKHLVAYLASHSEISVSLKWNGRNSGIHHGYPDISQCDNVLEVFTDSDWASDRQSCRSVSCCVILYGGCLLFSASRTQKIISLSSAEAEVYASSSGCSDAILLNACLVDWSPHNHLCIHGLKRRERYPSTIESWPPETSELQNPMVTTIDFSWHH